MLDTGIYEIIRQGIRGLFVAGVPVLLATSAAGILMAALQAATSVHDTASAYAARLLGLAAVLYLMYQSIWGTLVSLMEYALK